MNIMLLTEPTDFNGEIVLVNVHYDEYLEAIQTEECIFQRDAIQQSSLESDY